MSVRFANPTSCIGYATGKIKFLKQVLIPTMTCTLIISVVSILPRIILNTSFLRFVVSAVTALVFSVIVIWLLGFNKEERTLLHGKVMSFFGGEKS